MSELSGAELDRLIAERVMNWQPVTGQTALAPFAYKRPDGHIVHPYSAPHYSSSIDAAMEVVGKLRERGLQVSIRSWEGAVPWSVKFISYRSKEEVEEDGDNLPEAICNAALAAVGKE